ncbi:MAG: MoxR family ATPase [Geminicoccaceae bacterium]|nr:MoxR family ATPase [Geminicoccaceae bacterium]
MRNILEGVGDDEEQDVNDVTTDQLERQLDDAVDVLGRVRAEIGKVIFGQERVVEECLITILSGGHALLVGVPGLAKTRLAATLGTVLGLAEKRVQFTPDLMPFDILGSEVVDELPSGERRFRFIKGPIFSQLLMADEINRASPRTQAALLQAMQEGKVTVAGTDHPLPVPFHVLATQNPIEQEGTYPLPEAQLDRFLLQVNIDYPSPEAERKMMIATTTDSEEAVGRVMDGNALIALQALVRRLPIGERLIDDILHLVRAARPGAGADEELARHIAWGPGPRASQALMLAVRVRALLDQRLAPSREDLRAMAPPVLRHRMAVTFAARAEGIGVDDIIERTCARVLA